MSSGKNLLSSGQHLLAVLENDFDISVLSSETHFPSRGRFKGYSWTPPSLSLTDYKRCRAADVMDGLFPVCPTPRCSLYEIALVNAFLDGHQQPLASIHSAVPTLTGPQIPDSASALQDKL